MSVLALQFKTLTLVNDSISQNIERRNIKKLTKARNFKESVCDKVHNRETGGGESYKSNDTRARINGRFQFKIENPLKKNMKFKRLYYHLQQK